MRMRRKRNLDARLQACGERIIYMDRDVKNFQDKSEKTLLDYKSLFGNDNDVILEIGCGKGQFAIEFAKLHPELNVLAVEKSSNVIVDAAESAIQQSVQNLIFLRGNAEYLDCFIPEKSIGLIYLNFSCPFPKNTYASHRLTHKGFLEIYKKLLRQGGEIHQKTDNMHFFEFSIEQFTANGFGLKNVSLDLHNSDFEGNIMTEYETRFSQMGLPIYRLEAYMTDTKQGA